MKDAPAPSPIGRKRHEQLDLFDEPTRKKLKAGKGDHIKLTGGAAKVVVPGMASFAGEGPRGKYCQDCRWFGSVMVRRPDHDTTEHAAEACALWAKRMGRAAPQLRSSTHTIRVSKACKHFEDAGHPQRAFRISPSGELTEQ